MDGIDLLVILIVLVLLGVTLALSGKWKLLIKKPEIKNDEKDELSYREAARLTAMKAEIMGNSGNENENRVLCSFCETYVDISENELCPNCGASLKEAIEKEREKKALMQVELLRIQNEMENERMKKERTNKLIDTAAMTAASLISPIAGRTIVKTIIKNKRK